MKMVDKKTNDRRVDRDRRTAVVGAGLTGLYLALRLSRSGRRVTLFERDETAGGLGASFDCGGQRLERFYHHLFPGHDAMSSLIGELGLDKELSFRAAPMATFSQGHLYPFNSAADLLRFRPLPLLQRFRTGLAMASLLLQRDWRVFDRRTARDILVRRCGAVSYGMLWEPLLRQKFSDFSDKVSAAWLWDRINSRTKPSADRPSGSLGYLAGGLDGLFAAMRSEIGRNGGDIRLACRVGRVHPESGAIAVHWQSAGTQAAECFDDCILTMPLPQLMPLIPDMTAAYLDRLRAIPHVHSLCLVLGMRRSLTPFYWINMADAKSPFAVLVEHTRLTGVQAYGGRHLLYLSSYLADRDDPKWKASGSELVDIALPLLRQLCPDFTTGDIQDVWHFCAADSQPVFVQGHSRLLPPFTTPWPGLFILNSSQFYPRSRCLNTSLNQVDSFLALSDDGLNRS